MQDNLVSFTVDLDKPRDLSQAQREELTRLAAMSEDDIDYSDIPPMTFKNSFLFRDRHLYMPVNQPTPVQIDPDVLNWLRSTGSGYESRLNTILREAMQRGTERSTLAD